MARKNVAPLDAGADFPPLSLSIIDGTSLVAPSGLVRPFNVVLVNRGAWCPFCTGQLKAFQSGLTKLTAEGIGVASLSTDSLNSAQSLRREHGLEFPMAYGADVHAVAEALGVFYDAEPAHTAPFLQSAGFVLGPGGKILSATYSTGAIGRLIWQDVLSLVQYLKKSS